uniref:FtsK/SpoIIIE family protein n=1 Tax=Candidatus Kentrum sp. UNK TaxID=2126344 RepID=A0A451AYJ6_9GAMM|nr:MAG: FtsK/SpoIIIE family protein [Candidatus Kentron sp. UNK]VFK71122.1 MAG: FtsK/SpoIIIE family protein [Candidatus Kentron sp. UNK]
MRFVPHHILRGLCLIDPKRVEFEPYGKIPNLFGGHVFHAPADAFAVIEDLEKEMARRKDELARAGARDILAGRASRRLKLPFIVVFIKELAELLDQSPKAEEPLIRLAQAARATGIHLVISTQRPDADTFGGRLRSNLPWRIAMKVQKSTESKIILDEIGAEGLTGAGDMLARTSESAPVRVHGVKVGPDDIADAISIFTGGKK